MKSKENFLRKNINEVGFILTAFACFSFSPAWAEDAIKADNTAVNKRDASVVEVTADQQSSAKQDLLLTKRIRQEIMRDKNLSTNAHNIKIITQNGSVTLKGPVENAQEETTVLKLAKRVAGTIPVVDEVSVKN